MLTGYGAWLQPDAKRRVEQAIVEAERKTSAEFVVTVRTSSGRYRSASLFFASALTFMGLAVYVYHPTQFTDDLVPPALMLLFLLSAAFASQLGTLRRVLTPKRVREENVHRAAIAEFHAQGISVTRGRTGVLVYVSLLERSVDVIADVGVDLSNLDAEGARAVADLKNAVKSGGVESLITGLTSLSDGLGRILPRAADDRNELPDAVVS